VHNLYDPAAKLLYLGDGTVKNPTAIPQAEVSRVAGCNRYASGCGHGNELAIQNLLWTLGGMTVAADGSFYISDLDNSYGSDHIYKVAPDGKMTRVAGRTTWTTVCDASNSCDYAKLCIIARTPTFTRPPAGHTSGMSS
jgi:hypothetical protein